MTGDEITVYDKLGRAHAVDRDETFCCCDQLFGETMPQRCS